MRCDVGARADIRRSGASLSGQGYAEDNHPHTTRNGTPLVPRMLPTAGSADRGKVDMLEACIVWGISRSRALCANDEFGADRDAPQTMYPPCATMPGCPKLPHTSGTLARPANAPLRWPRYRTLRCAELPPNKRHTNTKCHRLYARSLLAYALMDTTLYAGPPLIEANARLGERR